MSNWIVVSVEVLDKEIWHLVWSQLGEEDEILAEAEQLKDKLIKDGYTARVTKGAFRKVAQDD